MEKRDSAFWSKQIDSAKQEHRSWIATCDKIGKAYTDKNMRENILYSNTQVLLTALVNNKPMPEISRRFWNSLEQDAEKTRLYNTTTRVAQSVIEYYFDECDVLPKVSDMVKKDLLFGRGVLWVEYIPTITKIKTEVGFVKGLAEKVGIVEEEYTEKITDRKLKIESLGVYDYLQSWGETEDKVWWKARRHLCDREQLKERFGYNADENELNYSKDDKGEKGSQQRCAEVWEIWDKIKKERIFFMPSSSKKILEVTKDPYKLTCFFPIVDNSFITEVGNVIPVPEYVIYSKNAEQINRLANKNTKLEEKAKYIVVCRQKDAKTAQMIQSANDGDVIGIQDFAGDTGNISQVVDITPIVSMINTNEQRITQLKNNIYEITGISDIMRGATDARETAEAQKIKGYYGGLRFKNRQDIVQSVFLRLFRIVAELLCEHWDWETLSQISAIELPTETQKQMLATQGQIVNEPSVEQVMELLRDDKMRSFVIAIESSASVFDDLQEQEKQINTLIESVMDAIQTAQQLNNPMLIKTFIPLVKMKMATIKISSAIENQLMESLEEMVKVMSQPKQEQPNIEQMKLDNDMQIQSAKLSQDKELKLAELQQKAQYDNGKLALEQASLELKRNELLFEQQANQARIQMGINPDTNLG